MMEHLKWIYINIKDGIVSCSSVDAMSILPFIRQRDFKIVELFGYKDGCEKNLLWENEEPSWVRRSHYVEISSLIEEDSFENILSMRINFDNNDFLNFCYGQLNVRLMDIDSLKKCTLILLEQYGYFAADKIWEFVSKQDYDMPIYYVLGMEEKDLGDTLNEMQKQGKIVHDQLHRI